MTGEIRAEEADLRLRGRAAGDQAGTSVAMAGDVDGDGHGDLLVGAPGEATGGRNSGAAYLYLGPGVGQLSLSNAVARFDGDGEAHGAGQAVASAGDVDSDGHHDLLVGAPGADDGRGSAYLVYGPVSGVSSLAEADLELTGEAGDARAGFAVAAAGDVDDDGFGDLLVGAYGAENAEGRSPGAAYLVLGRSSGPNY